MTALIRNKVTLAGAGVTSMMFAHGFGCDRNMWRFVSPAFEGRYETVLFDHVGSGSSDTAAYSFEKYSTLEGYAADVVEIGHELALKNAVFVGHSVSAVIGIIAAQKAPGMFKSLVLVAPSPCYINDGDYVGGFTRSQIDELLQARVSGVRCRVLLMADGNQCPLVLLRSMDARSKSPAVLVVDDEALLRWHATDVLSENGYVVLEADNAESALRILEARPEVRLLFTDIQMPGELDGLALAKKVHERWPEVLLLVTSGNIVVAEEDIPDDGRFVRKPYGEKEIVDQVAEMMASGHARPDAT